MLTCLVLPAPEVSATAAGAKGAVLLEGLGFRVWGLGFGVWGSGFRKAPATLSQGLQQGLPGGGGGGGGARGFVGFTPKNWQVCHLSFEVYGQTLFRV